jgi:transketolase
VTHIPCAISYNLPEGYQFIRGKGAILRQGKDAVFISYGPVMLEQIWIAADMLEAEGLSIRIINLPWLNTVDKDWLADVIDGAGPVFTADDHYLKGGQGEMIAAALAEMDHNGLSVRIGVNEIPACGSNDEVLRYHGLDAETLKRFILARIR